jgi:HEPN domain-containing protein
MLDSELHELSIGWLRKARGDLEAARGCAVLDKVPSWVVGFHCQQAVEKAIKGLLVRKGREPPRSHDIVRLAELLEQAGGRCPIGADALKQLLSFAVDDRYPTLTAPEATREEVTGLLGPAEAAVELLAEDIARWEKP